MTESVLKSPGAATTEPLRPGAYVPPQEKPPQEPHAPQREKQQRRPSTAKNKQIILKKKNSPTVLELREFFSIITILFNPFILETRKPSLERPPDILGTLVAKK